ncbi:MAG: IMP cyclohydrolase [Methanosphaera sp. rholeuAM270]|nr:MAG: IMP cyclohydrolase [Methanosphaera sp. rholeuAM270]
MYLGRIISIGSNDEGSFASYRVSSRSFPNRQSVVNMQKVAIIPTKGSEGDIYKNPYISYNCIDIIDDEICVVTNGSHTDIIAGKIREGMNMRDAIALSLLTMDYEKDDYNTPRIAGAINTKGEGFIGIVRDDGLEVIKVNPGESYYVSTYEHNSPREVKFEASNSQEATDHIYGEGAFEEFTNPVTSCAAFFNGEWEISVKNP